MTAAGASRNTIRKRGSGAPAPLSSPQERLFLLDRLMPGLAAYNVPTLVRVPTHLDANRLGAAFDAVIARHEILRTTIRLIDGEPVQEAFAPASVDLTVADVRALPEGARQAEADRILGELAGRPFDLGGDVLLRAGLVHLGETCDLLLVVFHHAASDHASGPILFAELDELYRAFGEGAEPQLPELSIQYGDYAQWQRDRLAGPQLEELRSYWQSRLAGAPARLDLPGDRPRPAAQSYRGRLREMTLSPDVAEPARALARRQRVSVYIVLLAAFEALLHGYTGVEDVVVGTPASGRHHDELAPLLGYFSNTLVLRTDLSGDPTFAELLDRARMTTLEAQAYGELPFERLVEAVNPERAQSHSPIFQVLFGYDVAPAAPPTLAGHVLEQLPVPGWQWSRFDLSIILRELPDGGLRATVEYATDLFDASTVERLVGHFQTLLVEAARDPDLRLSELPMLGLRERQEMLVEWNATAAEYDVRCLHELFCEQAARTPEQIGVASGTNRITYGELDRRSNQLARRLQALGLRPGMPVGICLERSIDLLVAMLGVLKAGAAYVPIEPTYPPQRQEFMLADAKAPVLLTQERYLGAVDPRGAEVLCLDRDRGSYEALGDGPLGNAADPETLAYVIYTSGSTGRPKGVKIRHRSVSNLISYMRERPGLTAGDVMANLTTPAFDLSVPDWWLPLTTGARLVIVPREATMDGVDLADHLARAGATIVQATPTTWQMLVDAGWKGNDSLKIVCGGEALPRKLAEELLARGESLWHMYGPTETTVWSSVLPLGPGDGPPPLGGPIANTSFYALDRHGQPVPIGVPGELHIGGDGVAAGYHERPDLTAEKFVRNPFGPGRLYRTGDLVRWREDGTLEYLGRIDQQIKLRGFRIELEEIEAVLASHPAVGTAVATVREDVPGDRRLVAYLVPADEGDLDVDDLRRLLKTKLPPFMVPSQLVQVASLPVTANQKLDRSSLPPPDGARPDLERTYVAPASPVEEALAAIWRDILGIERVGVEDNFFDLGGHSLLAVKMLARLHDDVGVALPLGNLFDGSTIRELAEAVTAGLLTDTEPEDLARLLAEAEAAEA
ncbi:MAG: amino acid adenylation domain-containing protein [Actinobacteria bacterium]|nr:amino acid adenylation domain-containing protein [Actinomycetota bacterium]